MSEQLTTTTVGEIVAADFRTAAVFEQFGIDFCCGGRRLARGRVPRRRGRSGRGDPRARGAAAGGSTTTTT